METTYPGSERPHSYFGWLDSHHTFSFGEHYDPTRMGFRALRVINDDRVAPGEGFGSHPHKDMEIISYVLEGALAHKDSLGTGSTIRPGDVQRMSAGTGVVHSEFNASREDEVHFLQIWIIPEKRGIPAGYEQVTVPTEEKRGKLRLIASRDGRQGSVTVHQDVSVYATVLAKGEEVRHELAPGRHAFVHVARGSAVLNGKRIGVGDGVAMSDERSIVLTADGDAEVLVFDLA